MIAIEIQGDDKLETADITQTSLEFSRVGKSSVPVSLDEDDNLMCEFFQSANALLCQFEISRRFWRGLNEEDTFSVGGTVEDGTQFVGYLEICRFIT